MVNRSPLAAIAICASLLISGNASIAEPSSPNQFKALASEASGLNLRTVEVFLEKGDKFFLKGDLDTARVEFDKARDVSKQLLNFYRDLGSSFKGFDARIPRNMDSNGRKALSLLS